MVGQIQLIAFVAKFPKTAGCRKILRSKAFASHKISKCAKSPTLSLTAINDVKISELIEHKLKDAYCIFLKNIPFIYALKIIKIISKIYMINYLFRLSKNRVFLLRATQNRRQICKAYGLGDFL